MTDTKNVNTAPQSKTVSTAPTEPAVNHPETNHPYPPHAGGHPHHPGPQGMPGMPLLYLSGGMKFGWALVGFLLGPVAILLAWLTNLTNYPEAKSSAIKYSIIGFAVMFIIGFLAMTLFGVAACTAASSMIDPAYWY